jgi:glycosyltransferase involved in cell wall biosynthesis
MRVLLDATAVPPQRGGVGRYVDNLVPALVRSGIDLRVVCKRADAGYYGELSRREAVAPRLPLAHPAARLAWEQLGLPAVVRRVAPDVLHSPHYTHPAAVRRPLVVTLHDATFFTDRGLHTSVKGPFFRAATRSAVRRAQAYVVPSRATAGELARVAAADPSRTHVAHLGVDATVFAPPSVDDVSALRPALGLQAGERYVTFLGTHEPRKNIPALIDGWASTAQRMERPPALVLAGAAGWDNRLAAMIDRVPPPLRVLRPGYLPVAQLAALLGGADVVAYPSLGEGFGLPVLEAMACGAAVLTTRRLALPEIGGDAVEYTEPDASSIAAALGRLLADDARRAELSRRAVARAAEFTWDACARAHLPAYEQACRVRSVGR